MDKKASNLFLASATIVVIIALKMRKKKVESEDGGIQSSSKNEMVAN